MSKPNPVLSKTATLDYNFIVGILVGAHFGIGILQTYLICTLFVFGTINLAWWRLRQIGGTSFKCFGRTFTAIAGQMGIEIELAKPAV